MSEENVEVVRRCFEVFDRRDLHEATDLLDPEVEWDTSRFPFPDLSGVYRGADAVLSWWARWLEAWTTMKFEIEDLIEAEDNVIVAIRGHGRGRNGVEVDVSFANIYTLRDGKLIRLRMYTDLAEALEAAGLSE